MMEKKVGVVLMARWVPLDREEDGDCQDCRELTMQEPRDEMGWQVAGAPQAYGAEMEQREHQA